MGGSKPVARSAASDFLSLPSTTIGRWSSRLLLAALVLVLVNNLAVMPITEQRTDLDLAQAVFDLLVGLSIIAAGTVGLFAVLTKRERSWAAITAVLLLIVTVGFNVAPYLHSA